MPRGKSKKDFPALYTSDSPIAAGGSVQQPQPDVRPEIRRMTGFTSAEEMAESLPDNTMVATEEPVRRKRRSKAEIEAERSKELTDPNMSDPRYAKAIAGMQAFGGPSLVNGAFTVVAVGTHDDSWKLAEPEKDKIEDYFYVLGKKYSTLDPSRHWITMALYFFGMLGSFVLARAAKNKGKNFFEQFTKWFKPEEPSPKPDEEIEEEDEK